LSSVDELTVWSKGLVKPGNDLSRGCTAVLPLLWAAVANRGVMAIPGGLICRVWQLNPERPPFSLEPGQAEPSSLVRGPGGRGPKDDQDHQDCTKATTQRWPRLHSLVVLVFLSR
jgi:hypothetical protein